MDLILRRDSHRKVMVMKKDGEKIITCLSERFNQQSHFTSAAKQLGIPTQQLMQMIVAFQEGRDDYKVVPLDAPQGTFSVVLRGRLQPAAQGQRITGADALCAFKDALAGDCHEPEPIIHWKGTDKLAALDIDWHGVPTLPTEQLNDIIRKVTPRPFAAWVTHGKGLRFMYHATDKFTADELAAMAALSVKQHPGTALVGIEIKDVTRHPLHPRGVDTCGPVHRLTQTQDAGVLAEMLGAKEVSEDEVAEWLVERGMEIGRRYDHDMCPARPEASSHNQPVMVHADSIYCMSCAALGVSLGSKTPGYFPYATLIGKQVPRTLRTCINNFTHWSQARFIVADAVQMSESVAKRVYAAALKVVHGDDVRLPGVFRAGADFIRLTNRWATEKGQTMTNDVRPILATLPVCQYVDADGEVKVSPERLARFDQPVDLSQWGYPALCPIWGTKIYGHRLPYRDPAKFPIVMHHPLLAPPEMEMFRPRYVPVGQRKMDEDTAWATLEMVFPGMNRNAVKLMIAAKGAAEGEIGLPPMIFLDGPSGSSKTAIAMIAAAICGDGTHAVQWTNDISRVRQSLMEGKEQGSFVIFNEVIKEINATKSSKSTLDFVLNLTPDSLSHKMYVGPVHLGALPVMCFTDTKLPVEIIQNTQLARRMVRVHLSRRVDWEESIKDNFGKLEYLRITDPLFAEAGNVILSRVIDDYFTKPMTFEEIAEKLGFTRLERSEVVDEKRWALMDLFRQVAVAPEAEGAYARRWSGRGWKLIKRSDRTELADAWSAVADAEWFTSEQCTETDWAGLLGVERPVDFEHRRTASIVAIRFTSGKKVNGEIADGNVELATRSEEGSTHRLGDSEPRQPQENGWSGVPERQYDPAPMSSGKT